MSMPSLLLSPLGNGSTAKAGGIVAGAYEHSAPVGLRVVNAVGDSEAAGIGAKVMIVYQNRLAIPLGAGVLAVANQPKSGSWSHSKSNRP